MSAPRQPEPPVPLDQIFSPGVVKLIWTAEALLVLLLLIGVGAIIFKIISIVLHSIRSGEKIPIFPSMPQEKLILFVLPIFYQYRAERDGWLGFLKMFKALPLIALFGTFVFSGVGQTPLHYVAVYFITFFFFGVLHCLFHNSLKENGKSLTFYGDGIGNRTKGRRTPYKSYKNVHVETISFRGSSFHSVKFFAKQNFSFGRIEEYGFSTEEIGALIKLLRNKDVPIEGRIEDAQDGQLR